MHKASNLEWAYAKLKTTSSLNIRGRIILNYWKIAREELSLRTTTFEGTVGHVLGITIPSFQPEVLTGCWLDGKSYLVNRYIKYRCLKLSEVVEKVGSIGIGREVSHLCHLSLSDALTRGTQIRTELVRTFAYEL